MQYVTLDELDTDGRMVRIDDRTSAALTDTGLVSVQRRADGRSLLLPRGRVGAVRTAELQIQVTPKARVGLARMLFVLGYAVDPKWRADEVFARPAPDLLPALAETLARVAERALARGVLQGYVHVEESLMTVRGRIRMSDQLRIRPGRMVPLEVGYDDYGVDITENRILKSALVVMLAVPGLPERTRRRLAHQHHKLDGVTPLRQRRQLPSWQATRLNTRYHSALHISELILRHNSAEAGDGGTILAAFVVEMSKVYEDFVTTALTESLRRYDGSTRAQYPAALDDFGQLPLRIDVVHSVNQQPALIFDAKYKAASAGSGYPNADYYQMLAYCTALQLKRAYLVYAQGNAVVTRRIRHTNGIEIVDFPIDLRLPPLDLLASVDRLADLAWGNWTSSSPTGSPGPAWN